MEEMTKTLGTTGNQHQSSCSKQAPEKTREGTSSPGTESNPNFNNFNRDQNFNNISNVIHDGTSSPGIESNRNLTDGGDKIAKTEDNLADKGTINALNKSIGNLAVEKDVNRTPSIPDLNKGGTSSAQTNNNNDGGPPQPSKILDLTTGLNLKAKLKIEINDGNGNSTFEIEIKLYAEDNTCVKKFKEHCQHYQGLELTKSDLELKCNGVQNVAGMFSIRTKSDSKSSYYIFDTENTPFGDVTTTTTTTLEQLFKHPNDTSFLITNCTVSGN